MESLTYLNLSAVYSSLKMKEKSQVFAKKAIEAINKEIEGLKGLNNKAETDQNSEAK